MLIQRLQRLRSSWAFWIVFGGAVAVFLYFSVRNPLQDSKSQPKTPAAGRLGEVSVELTPTQAASILVEKVVTIEFRREMTAVGSVDFNQNSLVSVFSPYTGRIINVGLSLGDPVEKDQPLFTVDSPELLTAESNVISAEAALVLQNRALARLKPLLKAGGASQQQVDQAISDQQAAEGALKSARDTLRIFGKTPDEIDRIIAERSADSRSVVRSPLSGFVTARAAVPGQLVQPGVAPAPFVVADTSTMWLMANVPESDTPELRVGQSVRATVAAFPDVEFGGRITVLAPALDPTTRRQAVRIEVSNPNHILHAGMFANFKIRIGAPFTAPAVREDAVVRESDGTMVCWSSTDKRRFVRRVIRTGLRQDGFVQIIAGVRLDELVVDEGALFLSNQAAIQGAN